MIYHDFLQSGFPKYYLSTASAHLTFSLASPPTSLFASWMVALVASASC